MATPNNSPLDEARRTLARALAHSFDTTASADQWLRRVLCLNPAASSCVAELEADQVAAALHRLNRSGARAADLGGFVLHDAAVRRQFAEAMGNRGSDAVN